MRSYRDVSEDIKAGNYEIRMKRTILSYRILYISYCKRRRYFLAILKIISILVRWDKMATAMRFLRLKFKIFSKKIRLKKKRIKQDLKTYRRYK